MKVGALYGIGVGPGDPDLITVKAVDILSRCLHVFVPKAKPGVGSLSLSIAKHHLRPDAEIHEIVYPMTTDEGELASRWREASDQIIAVLRTGKDACFLTLGDPFLYSTYIYLVQALRKRNSDIKVVTVPGVTAFSAAAALGEFPVGKGKEPVIVIPTADDLTAVRRVLRMTGTVVLMKIGQRLPQVLDALEEARAIDRAVFVARAGQADERVETDLRKLRKGSSESGNLSLILVHVSEERT